MIPPGFFPHIPDEVLSMWLDPLAELYGWPFETLDDSTDDTKWRYILTFMPLRELHDLTWNLESIDIATQPFRPGSLDAVQGLLQQHTMGYDTLYADLINTKERFWTCASYVRDHGTIPKPLVLHEIDGAVHLLDGNHRLAAVRFVSQIPEMAVESKLPAWVARRMKNEEQGVRGNAG
jgi:hypothetical protein